MRITSLAEAVDFARETLAASPERDADAIRAAAMSGRRRRWSGLYVGLHTVPHDATTAPLTYRPPEVEMRPGPEAELARELVGRFGALDMLNPVSTCFGTGRGTGTLVTLFGVPLNPDLQDQPAFTRTIDDVLADPLPVVATAGIMPEIRARIEAVKDHLPAGFRIALPDMQGPYNIAHQLTGDEALLAPLLEPDRFHALMDRVTSVWIEAYQTIAGWIGQERLAAEPPRIAECSVNLVSRRTYESFILPYDLRIREALGPVGIHTCSGPHVFQATLAGIPDMVYTEAGVIKKAVAGYTPVEEALAMIGDAPILLHIGEELHDGDFFEQIRGRLDLFKRHPRLLFSFTMMNRHRAEAPIVRDLHRRLDAYWEERFAPALDVIA